MNHCLHLAKLFNVRITKLYLLILGLLFSFHSIGAAIPEGPVDPKPREWKKVNARTIEKMTGKKLTLLDKVKLTLLKWKLSKLSDKEEMTEKQKKQATASLILGIASFGLMFIPYVGILSIPAAILAIIFGVKSLKGNSNTKGIIGLAFGSATIVVIILLIIILASGGFWV